MLEPTKKAYPVSKDKEEAIVRQYEGTNTIKSNPIAMEENNNTTHWRTIIPKKSFSCCEGSEPHIRLPILGIQQKD